MAQNPLFVCSEVKVNLGDHDTIQCNVEYDAYEDGPQAVKAAQ